MFHSDLNRILTGLQASPGLRQEFRQRRGDPDGVIRLVAGKGYSLTGEEAEELIRSFHELSEDEFEQAAGGAWSDPPLPGTPSDG
jgi:predicted ribosomally synthesized peptide with nif11-like leader